MSTSSFYHCLSSSNILEAIKDGCIIRMSQEATSRLSERQGVLSSAQTMISQVKSTRLISLFNLDQQIYGYIISSVGRRERASCLLFEQIGEE